MNEANIVTISLEEYIDLRRRADESFFLLDRIGRLDQEITNLAQRVWELERKMDGVVHGQN